MEAYGLLAVMAAGPRQTFCMSCHRWPIRLVYGRRVDRTDDARDVRLGQCTFQSIKECQ